MKKLLVLILCLSSFSLANQSSTLDDEDLTLVAQLSNIERKVLNQSESIERLSNIIENNKDKTQKHNEIKESFGSLKTQIKQVNESIDSLNSKMKILESSTNELELKNDRQIRAINDINYEIGRTIIFSDVILPILLSIISAIIFWFVFNYFPESRRTKQIRKKVDINLLQTYHDLFAVFDTVLSSNLHSTAFHHQRKIRSGKLTKEDIVLSLQNKCLNDSFLYDQNVALALIPIGKELYKRYYSIEKKTDSIFNFSSCLTSEEILLLEDIRTTIEAYNSDHFERSAETTVGDVKLYPVDPSLSYMGNNFFKLYGYYLELQKVVFKSNFQTRELFLNKVMNYFYLEDYELCHDLIKSNVGKYSSDKSFLEGYLFACLIEMNKFDPARNILKQMIMNENKPDLVSHRHALKNYIDHESVADIFKQNYTENEITKMNQSLDREEKAKENYLATAKTLRDYYENKSANNQG